MRVGKTTTCRCATNLHCEGIEVHTNIGELLLLLDLSGIKIECNSQHVHGAFGAAGAVLMKKVGVEHQKFFVGKLQAEAILALI